MSAAGRVREFEIIERVFRRSSQRSDVIMGIGDDAAITRLPADVELVTTTDTLVCGTHFVADAPAESVGHRSMACNLSDLAAMGAEPRWASLAISLPSADSAWLEGFARGLFTLADRYGVELIGGDTVRGPLAVTVTLQGSVPQGQAIMRGGAAAGDLLYVTGNPGDAIAGRLLLNGELSGSHVEAPGAVLAKRFLFPEPRIEIGLELRALASAMIDISDGLRADLMHLLKASGGGADLDVSRLPISAQLAELVDETCAHEYALCGGDDYELCFSVPPQSVERLQLVSKSWPCPISHIGAVTDSGQINLLFNGQRFELPDSGFRHFA